MRSRSGRKRSHSSQRVFLFKKKKGDAQSAGLDPTPIARPQPSVVRERPKPKFHRFVHQDSPEERTSHGLHQGDDLTLLFPKLISAQPNHTFERVWI